MNTVMTWASRLPRWLQWVIGILLVSLIIDYWQWSLAIGIVCGAVAVMRKMQRDRIARHAACLVEIDRLEDALGIRH